MTEQSGSRGQGGSQKQWPDLVITICDSVAQNAGMVDETSFQAFQASITHAWTSLGQQLPTLRRDQLERRPSHDTLVEEPGFQILNAQAKRALSGLRYFADSPNSYIENEDRGQVDGAVAQVLAELMPELDAAQITVPAQAKQAIQAMTSSGPQHRRPGSAV